MKEKSFLGTLFKIIGIIILGLVALFFISKAVLMIGTWFVSLGFYILLALLIGFVVALLVVVLTYIYVKYYNNKKNSELECYKPKDKEENSEE